MIKHTFIYFFAFALPGLLGFASFSVYTRVLTPAEYAIYSVGVSVAFLIGNVCFGWIRFAIGRFQSELPDFNFLPFALACHVVTTIVVAPLVIGAAFWWVSASVMVIAGVLSMALAQALFETTQEMRRARHQSISFTKASVTRSVISITLSVALASLFHKGAVVLFSIAAGFSVVSLLYIFNNRRHLVWSDVFRGPTRRFLAYGMPLALSGLVFSGNSTLARAMVASSLGAAAAGQYGAALDVTGQLTTMIAGSVCSIMGPAAIRAYGLEGPAGARGALATGLELFLGILLPVAMGLAIVAQPFANIVSGHDFEGVLGKLIPLLIVSRALNVFSQFYLHLGFQIVEKPLRQVACGSATLVINVVLNFLLTKSFGLTGAAVALLLADLGGVLVSFLLLHPVFPMPFPAAKVAPIVGAVAAMAVACQSSMYFVAGSDLTRLAVTALTGIVVYGAVVLTFDVCQVRTLLFVRGYRSILNQLRRV